MRIVAISDTHSYHRQINLPDGDCLLIVGDISWRGEISIIDDFSNWLKLAPHKYKLFTPGNHDLSFQREETRKYVIDLIQKSGTIYLENENYIIDGYKFYMSPHTPIFGNWAFMLPPNEIANKWSKIPEDVDVLACHGMPYGILDEVEDNEYWGHYDHVGCPKLLERINDLKQLKAFFGGHLHLRGGQTVGGNGQPYFSNCAICQENYKPTNPPVVIDL